MDKRAAIPVTLPRDNPTVSYWQDPPDAEIADLRSTLELPSTADVVIIGSGITGAAVAWGLLQDEGGDGTEGIKPSVVMLEARQTCSGATGRNGGHTKAASYRSFLDNARDLGSTAAAAQIARLEYANILAVHGFAHEHGIDCDSNPCDTVDVLYDAAQWTQAKVAVAAMREALAEDSVAGSRIADYVFHEPDYVRDTLLCGKGGLEDVYGAVQYAAGSLSAYKFGVGVLKLCLAAGLNLQTHTAALGVHQVGAAGGRKWRVETARGTILAAKLVLATNGYTARLHPRFQGAVVPLRGQVTAQRPGANMPQTGLRTTYSFIYDKGYEYMITRPAGSRFEGDLIIGGGLVRAPDDGLLEYGVTDDGAVNEVISSYLRDTLPLYFGDSWGEDSADGRVRREWTGVMGFSPDGYPFVGAMPAATEPEKEGGGGDGGGEENLWAAVSFQGHGMVLCWMCARALVAMMKGRDDDELRSWFPDAYRITERRLRLKFKGRLHNSALAPEELEKAKVDATEAVRRSA